MNLPPDPSRKEPRPRTPAPRIDPVFLWPTPSKADLMFYVERSGDLPVNKTFEYGSQYFDPITYPDHKLVYVSPQTEDKWSRWYYASKRLLEDEYNWSFTDADIGGTKFKAVAREYVTLRDEFDPATPAMGAAMADLPKDKFDGDYVLAERIQAKTPDTELNSLFVFERRTYVQRVTISEDGYDKQLEGNLQSRSTLFYRGELIDAVAIETLVADETNTYWGLQADKTSRSAKQLSTNWFLVIETRETLRRKPDGAIDVGWPSKQLKSVGIESLVPAKFRRQVVTTQTTEKRNLAAANVDDIPAPATLTGNETKRQNEKFSDYHYNETIVTEVIDVEADPLVGELTDTWGVNTTEESLVPDGTPTDFGFGVKKGVVDPLGNGESIKSTENYPAPASPNVIYTLLAQEEDEVTQAVFDINKSLVNASAAVALAAAARGVTTTAELQPLDKWHTIMLVSSVRTPPANKTWYETGNINLPNVLEAFGVIWDASSKSGHDENGVDSIADIIANNRGWQVTASASASASVSGLPYTKINMGYRGPAVVRVTRTFTIGPPGGYPSIYKFQPGVGTITIFGATASGAQSASKSGVGNIHTASGGGSQYYRDTKMVMHEFGPVVIGNGASLAELGDNKNVSESVYSIGGSTPSGGLYPAASVTINIAGKAEAHLPSTSGVLASGTEYVLNSDTKPWRNGYWVTDVYYARVP